MTNKEIRFELAKVALTTCQHMTSESLTESLKNLYEWVVAEDAEEEKEQTMEQDEQTTSLGKVFNVMYSQGHGGYVTRINNALNAYDIYTVEDLLLKFGKHDFLRLRNLGKKSLTYFEDALYELGIKEWH